MPQIRIGFIGLSTTGWAAIALFPSLQVPSVRSSYVIVALCTSSAASASIAAEHYGRQTGSPIKAYYGDDGVSQLVRDPEVDLVVVSIKAPEHKDPVLAAIEAGKDVFVEWPAGSSLEETTEFQRQAKAKGVKVMVGLQGRHSAASNAVKDVIASGRLGKVLSSTMVGFMSRESLYWGPTVNERREYIHHLRSGVSFAEIILGHQLDTFTHILGDFASVSATAATMYPIATIVDSKSTPLPTIHATSPDHVALSGILVSGALVSINYRAGYRTTPGRRRFLWEIDCENGSIRVEPAAETDNLMHIHNMAVYVCGEKIELGGTGLLAHLAATWLEYANEKHTQAVGKYATIEDAVKNRRLLEVIKHSARDGKTVHL
ncbi:transcription regulator gal80 [Pleurotus pulmonarius]|nr:transcription regulator gal80 [Pleurotus pulmonarius]KAF4604368.1 transcription regulator gal80 [Pleurotus pulmonarius]KAF4609194.1 transcription regulator gal80 [Pleurotus pulmonarius]